MDFLNDYGGEILLNTGEHLYMAGVALLLGILVAVPLGIALTRSKGLAGIVIGLASILQTIPSLALLAMMIPFLGIGKVPAIVAMFIYSLLPILRNTYVGVESVDRNVKDAAKGIGMSSLESIIKVEVPLALPVMMAGIRLSAVYVIAWTTLAAYIGAGGLGDFIFNGLELYKIDLILAGTIPITILALLTDFLLGKLEDKLQPKLRSREEVSHE